MSNESIQQQVRGHFKIFIGVVALTLISVIASMLSDGPLVPVVMIIAAVQASLILAFLMHVKSEASSVRWLLAMSAVFLAVLFGVLLLVHADPIQGTEEITIAPATPTESGEAH